MTDLKISCVVPVYNEGPRVLAVLDVLIASCLLDEIIVVNDGSKDNTEAILKDKPGIKLISYPVNRGKSHAVRVGFDAARNDYVMMIDSDLLGLDVISLQRLIEPIKKGEADMVISLRIQRNLLVYRFFGLDFVSGERIFRKSIIENLDELEKLPGFGLESYLNQIVIKKKLRLRVVRWDYVISPRKSTKFGWWRGMKGDWDMVRQIVRYLTLTGVVSMYYQLLRLRV